MCIRDRGNPVTGKPSFAFIYAYKADNAAITGGGKIDANGHSLSLIHIYCEFAQSTRVIFEAEVVVVAPASYKLLVGRRYVSAYLFRYSEVKRCVFNLSRIHI